MERSWDTVVAQPLRPQWKEKLEWKNAQGRKI